MSREGQRQPSRNAEIQGPVRELRRAKATKSTNRCPLKSFDWACAKVNKSGVLKGGVDLMK